jgi:aminopeptidase
MADLFCQKLADLVVRYSLAIQAGDRLIVESSPVAEPLIAEVYRAAVRAGAHVHTMLSLDSLRKIRIEEGSDDQIALIQPWEYEQIENQNKILSILSASNVRLMTQVSPERIAKYNVAGAALGERFMARSAAGDLDWCVALYPTNAYAQEAGMALRAYEAFVYDACLLNAPDPVEAWRAVHAAQENIRARLMTHREIHIVAPGTDVTYNVAGRTWISASGQRNLPDGEVFTSPLEDSVEGVVTFSYPAYYQGQGVSGVRLTFARGKVVAAQADQGADFLNQMLETDAGARTLGEVAFGLNYGIQRFTRNILFDEKIGGTMHMAIGASYPETGGVNISAIHWDFICDLHQGQVFADGTLIYEDGHFLAPPPAGQ